MCNFVPFRKNKLKTLWPILPHELFGWKNDETCHLNFLNHSRYYWYGYAESLYALKKILNFIFVCGITKFLKKYIFLIFNKMHTILKFLCIGFFCFIFLTFAHAQSQVIYYFNIGSYKINIFCFLIIFFVNASKGITKWPVFPQTHFTPHYPMSGMWEDVYKS